MKCVFLGPPGAGKGTMAKQAAAAFKLIHISTGDLFREAVGNDNDLGRRVKSIMERGDLVPDDVTIELVRERTSRADCSVGYILDGYPRTIAQAEALEKLAALDKVVNFMLSDREVIRRLSGRRTCPACGKNFHIEFMPPAKADVCDACKNALITRKDDAELSIQNRLVVYKKQTEPLIDFYKRRNLLIDIDAAPSPDTVFMSLRSVLG